MDKIILLIGKSGVGKTTLARKLLKKLGIKEVVSTTSRPIREGEVNGIDYYFKTKKEMIQLNINGKFAEFNEYRNNYYGVEKSEFEIETDVILVIDVNGYQKLKKLYKDRIIPIYIYTTDDIRMNRMMSRELVPDIKEIKERFKYDNELFKIIEKDKDIYKIDNSEELEKATRKIEKIISKK